MQFPIPPPSAQKKDRFFFFLQNVAQCSETNEKSIFPFLFLKYRRSKFLESCEIIFFVPKGVQCSETNVALNFYDF